MLKILKSDLEAKERSILIGSTYSETPPNRYSSSALYSGFKSFSKKCVFCGKNYSTNRCVKITDPHARKWFLSSNGHCSIARWQRVFDTGFVEKEIIFVYPLRQ